MRVKIAGTLTAAQRAAVNRAKAYHGKQPHTEFFADCVIWYKNDWAVVIPMSHTVPYYWAAGSNTTLTNLGYTPPTTFGSLGTITQPAVPYAGTVGSRTATADGTHSILSYSNWVYDSTNPSSVLFYTPSSLDLVQPTAFTNSLDPSVRWHWLNGVCTIKDSDASVVATTFQWTPCFPSYELLADSAAWNAFLFARHTAVIDTFRNASPPAVSVSPATSVTVTVGATSALAHASVSASPTGLSSFTEIGAVLTVASAPLAVTLVPDLSDAEDEVIRVDFYRNGVLFATSEANPFTHEMTALAVEVAVYSAMYTDASEVTDVAALTVTGLLSHVEFFRGEVSIADVATPPYACADPTLAVGEYTYSAVVYDDAGVPSAGEVTVSAVGPALTGDALTSVAASVPIAGRPIDAEHDYARPYFDGTFWKRGGIAYLIPLSPTAGGEERGMYYDLRLDADLTDLKVEGYARLRCGDAADLTAPITILDWVPVPAATLPIDGSFPMYVVRVADATNYGEYPTFGWWYDEVEQIQKADMALDPAPNFEIALFDFTRDTIT